jgi:hypothetical protein
VTLPDETKFEVDSLWAKPYRAYHVQHEPDQATIRQITELQDQIEATAARKLLRVPAHSLHLTVLKLFPVTANIATPDDALWSQHTETWLERIATFVPRHIPSLSNSTLFTQRAELSS